MSFGMRIWSPEGLLQLDENSFTMRVVLSQIISPQTFGAKYIDIAISGVTPSNSSAFVLPIGPVTSDNGQCEPEMGNGFVRVWRTIKGDPYGNSSITITQQRLVVVRTS